jgi:hypothetical protein
MLTGSLGALLLFTFVLVVLGVFVPLALIVSQAKSVQRLAITLILTACVAGAWWP